MSFDLFWQNYPRHRAKKDARKAWDQLAPSDELGLLIAAAAELQARTNYAGKPKEWIPYPATWLRGEQWEDDIEAPATRQHVHTAICREYGMCPEAMAEHNEQAKRSAEQWAAEEARRLAER